MRNRNLMNILCFPFFVLLWILFTISIFAAPDSSAKDPAKIALTVRYPEKLSQFLLDTSDQNHKNELRFIVSGKTKKSRNLNSNDLNWLKQRLSTFDFTKSNPGGNCRMGDLNLVYVNNKESKYMRKCLGARDAETKRMMVLLRTLDTFL